MFPETIDTNRLSEKQTSRPVNAWDYIEFEGSWYPKRSYQQLERIWFLRDVSIEFGREFKTNEEFHQYVNEKCSYEEEHICEICGFKSTSLARLETHRGSKNCIFREKRIKATRRGEVFIPDHQHAAFCGTCDKPFANKYCLATHEKTKSHKDLVKGLTVPSTCLCGKKFKGKGFQTRFRRHLREGKKCHKLANKTDENRIKWLNLHRQLQCKFPRASVLIYNEPIEVLSGNRIKTV